MAEFTLEQLTRPGLRRRQISIPDTDGHIFIRELSTQEVRDYAARFDGADASKQIDLIGDLVFIGLVDSQGRQVFNSDSAALIKNLGVATLTFIAGEISKLSGMQIDPEQKKTDATP